MRVQVVVTDHEGKVFEGEAVLQRVSERAGRGRSRTSSQSRENERDLDFELPVRAFVSRYARGQSGTRKFVLLLARLAGGDIARSVDHRVIQKTWNTMKEPMGGPYNAAYATRAKSKGWVDTPQTGSYCVRPSWKEVLE